MPSKGLIERLANGEKILIAEGYLMEIERRGYLQCGGFVPEVVLENPDVVRNLHREFVHAGSDVVEAFTYYGHREKLRTVGREDDLERLNRTALKIAREVADETGTLMAGNLCNSNLYDKDNREADDKIKAMLKEQVEWAVEEGADYIIVETISNYGEAKMVLEAVKKYGHGLPLVITMSIYEPDMTMDGLPITEALRKLEEAGAVVVGLNCGRGPKTMLPTIREIRKVCKGPIAALPVTFRTTETCRTWIALKDTETGNAVYPTNVSCVMCNREDIRQFAEEAKAIGVNYVGLCCGNAPYFFREIAEVHGRKPEACRYSPNVSANVIVGKQTKHAQKMKNITGTANV